MRDVIRRNWRFWVTLAEVLLLTAFLARYIGHRQTLSDQRAERQRSAICAILATIPGHIPPEIGRARTVFARPGHPSDCQPIARPAAKRTPAPRPTPTATATVVITRSIPQPTATASASATPRPSPTRNPRPSPSPTPKPSPSRTCLPLMHICT